MPRTILVTGANKGIGFSIVQLLATRSPEDHLLLAVRDISKGEDAVTKLRSLGIKSPLDIVKMDVTSDESVLAAEKEVREKHKKLDILINNAGIARFPEAIENLREIYSKVFDTNVASVVFTCEVFLPLLKETSSDPRIIQVSSARGSFGATVSGRLPPVTAISYSASKAALNLATLLLSQRPDNKGVVFQCPSPGHCKTDFNNNRGVKDPLDGARVIAELALEEKGRHCGTWEIEGESPVPTQAPW